MIFLALGFFVGIFGTIMGIGGGFILVPILLTLFPDFSQGQITGISLAVVALNATSGSVAYFRRKQIQLKAGIVFILAGLPGAFVGVWLEDFTTRDVFESLFGGALIFYAVFLYFKNRGEENSNSPHVHVELSKKAYAGGSLVSFFVGFLASFLGIGGGVIYVPFLSQVLRFPVKRATATAQFILAATAWAATAEHFNLGHISVSDPLIYQTGIGAILGAQVGAALSRKISGKSILRMLSFVLIIVGLKLLF